jgi:hypothetical protein
LREDLTLRRDTSGDKFHIELDKQALDNRGVAGELLLRRAEKIKTRFGEDIRIGRFAGFDLFIRSGFNNTAELVLRGKNSYMSARFSPKRANLSVSCWRTSSPWSNPKPCSNGIANWSPRNGTFPAAGTPNRVGRPSQLRLNNW